MSSDAESILNAALKLSEADRLEVALALEDSVSPKDGTDLSEEEFAAELERRMEEFKRDASTGIPWSELKNMT